MVNKLKDVLRFYKSGTRIMFSKSTIKLKVVASSRSRYARIKDISPPEVISVSSYLHV